MMTITNVEWVADHQHRSVLQLRVDGRLAHILSEQKLELTRRGMVQGIDFFASEWRDQAARAFIRGDIEPGLSEATLAGCTDDPRVLALYDEMCQAIRTGTWRPGPRRPHPEDRSAHRAEQSAVRPPESNRGHPMSEEARRPC
jgi:hypothetical protein